jgi:hypothetical protein
VNRVTVQGILADELARSDVRATVGHDGECVVVRLSQREAVNLAARLAADRLQVAHLAGFLTTQDGGGL